MSDSSSQMVPSNILLYVPEYNPDTDKYFDKNPFLKGERTPIKYGCPCKCNSFIENYSDFKRHMKLNTHQHFINNYHFFNKPLLDLKEELKTEVVKSTKKTRNLGKLLKSLQKLELRIEKANSEKNDLITENVSFASDLESLHSRLREKISECQEHNKRTFDLEKNNRELTSELDTIKKEIEKLKIENSDLKDTVQSIDNFEYTEGIFTNPELFYDCE